MEQTTIVKPRARAPYFSPRVTDVLSMLTKIFSGERVSRCVRKADDSIDPDQPQLLSAGVRRWTKKTTRSLGKDVSGPGYVQAVNRTLLNIQ